MKNAIFQYYLPHDSKKDKEIMGTQSSYYFQNIPKWAHYSIDYFKKYAEVHNADYILGETKTVPSSTNYFEVTRIFRDEIFDQYDKVLYVDLDVMPKDMEQNIFNTQIVDIAAWPEHGFPDFDCEVSWHQHEGRMKARWGAFDSKVVQSKTAGCYRMLNSGVMLWSKDARLKARNLFDDHEKYWLHDNPLINPDRKRRRLGSEHHFCLDQPYINCMINKFDFDVVELDRKWNRFPTKDENVYCCFAHYVGYYKDRISKTFPRKP